MSDQLKQYCGIVESPKVPGVKVSVWAASNWGSLGDWEIGDRRGIRNRLGIGELWIAGGLENWGSLGDWGVGDRFWIGELGIDLGIGDRLGNWGSIGELGIDWGTGDPLWIGELVIAWGLGNWGSLGDWAIVDCFGTGKLGIA